MALRDAFGVPMSGGDAQAVARYDAALGKLRAELLEGPAAGRDATDLDRAERGEDGGPYRRVKGACDHLAAGHDELAEGAGCDEDRPYRRRQSGGAVLKP